MGSTTFNWWPVSWIVWYSKYYIGTVNVHVLSFKEEVNAFKGKTYQISIGMELEEEKRREEKMKMMKKKREEGGE